MSLSCSKRLIVRDWILNEKNTSPNRSVLTHAFKNSLMQSEEVAAIIETRSCVVRVLLINRFHGRLPLHRGEVLLTNA